MTSLSLALLSLTANAGTLVIVGGGGMPQDIFDAFMNSAGGRSAVICLIPTATEDPEGAYDSWKDEVKDIGATLKLLDVRRRKHSSSPSILNTARSCTGFWFSGGDQNRIGDAIVGTPLHRLLLELFENGATMGGTSAGAAVMSRIMLTGEDRNGKYELDEIGAGAYRTREGMGFLPADCIVDQHFLRRNRQNRLFSVLMEHPGHLGLGIDEATALVVTGSQARVIGDGRVMVFDPESTHTRGNSFTQMRVHLLERGQGIDLATRELLTEE